LKGAKGLGSLGNRFIVGFGGHVAVHAESAIYLKNVVDESTRVKVRGL
jgi:hypothetical protein